MLGPKHCKKCPEVLCILLHVRKPLRQLRQWSIYEDTVDMENLADNPFYYYSILVSVFKNLINLLSILLKLGYLLCLCACFFESFWLLFRKPTLRSHLKPVKGRSTSSSTPCCQTQQGVSSQYPK